MNKKLMLLAVAVEAASSAQVARELVNGYTWEYIVSGGDNDRRGALTALRI